MSSDALHARFARSRAEIGSKLRDLREARRWSQNELAARLAISQPQLSKIESGEKSLSAEQLLLILKLFNVPATHFAERKNDESNLQNALARLGATHLIESDTVLPSEALSDAQNVVREAIVDGSPRRITALAPVLVQHAQRLNLGKLQDDLSRIGFDRRLVWVVENTLAALERLAALDGPRGKKWRYILRGAELPLRIFASLASDRRPQQPAALDLLDDGIRTQKTLIETQKTASEISQRWGIVTGLHPEDFERALEASQIDV